MIGYFSNFAVADLYEMNYCSRCIHNQDPDKGCAVWLAHMLHNYEECDNDDSILHILIPRADGPVWNAQCAMFVEALEAAKGGEDE